MSLETYVWGTDMVLVKPYDIRIESWLQRKRSASAWFQSQSRHIILTGVYRGFQQSLQTTCWIGSEISTAVTMKNAIFLDVGRRVDIVSLLINV
jgi:hypothetical protein